MPVLRPVVDVGGGARHLSVLGSSIGEITAANFLEVGDDLPVQRRQLPMLIRYIDEAIPAVSFVQLLGSPSGLPESTPCGYNHVDQFRVAGLKDFDPAQEFSGPLKAFEPEGIDPFSTFQFLNLCRCIACRCHSGASDGFKVFATILSAPVRIRAEDPRRPQESSNRSDRL